MDRLSSLRGYINTYDVEYCEAHALNALNDACVDALEISNMNSLIHDEPWDNQFTINIAGQSIAFNVGGPQIEALFTFINQIAYENMYVKGKNGRYLGWGEEDE